MSEWRLTSTWVSGVQRAVSGRRGCWQPGYALAWRALRLPHPALGTSGAAPRCGWLHGWRRASVRLSTLKGVNGVQFFSTGHLQTWRWRESSDIWFDVRREGWLHVLVWRQVWRDVASWGHWRGRIARHWGVRVVTHRSGWLYWRQLNSK